MEEEEIKDLCKKQGYEGEIEVTDGCENEGNVKVFRRKCKKTVKRKIPCSQFKKHKE